MTMRAVPTIGSSPNFMSVQAQSITSRTRISPSKLTGLSSSGAFKHSCSLQSDAGPSGQMGTWVTRWRNAVRLTKALHFEVSGRALVTRAVKKSESSSKSEESLSLNSVVEVLDDVQQSTDAEKRLFSNLNTATLKHEPGILLVSIRSLRMGANFLEAVNLSYGRGLLACCSKCGEVAAAGLQPAIL
jgi:hypothetical protein